jgi:thimet oligopeptidase
MIFYSDNKIDFQALTPQKATAQAQQVVENARKKLAKIYEIPANQRTFDNTVKAYDDLLNELSNTGSISFLLFCTSTDEALRNTCNEAAQEIDKFTTQLALDEKLFLAMQAYAETPEARALLGYRQKMLAELLQDFRQNGLALPEDQRKVLQALQNQLIAKTSEFQKNISEANDFLLVSEEEITGLPEDYKNSHRQAEGNYKISLNYPSYIPFMQYAVSDKARKTLLIKYLNKAADKNLQVLQEVLVLRKRIATLLNFPSFAAYRHSTLMVKKPETVWNFELDLAKKVKIKAALDYQELLECKQNSTQNQAEKVLHTWETSYYRTILMREKYEVDNLKVKEYFETNQVLGGLLTIAEKLFGIKFEEKKDANVWHEEVRYLEVTENKKLVGRVYLDLFPRPNKYSHAACFPLISGKKMEDGTYQTPTLALVCNFPAAHAERPSLLTHNEVETFFHEFGHGLHVLLTESPVCMYAGTSTKRDFVEVPSQWFEAWAWNYESLSFFAKHYQTGEILPKSLFDKMQAAKNLGSGLFAQSQLLYALYDLTLHDHYEPEGTATTTDVLRELQANHTQFPYIEGTHFQAAFGHLTGYAASYYGYMWAKVYAEDCISLFEEKGMFDTETGRRFRHEVLAKGGTTEELLQVVAFLGREPNSEAFLKSLGL